MLLGERSFPIVVEQVVVERLHGLELVALEEVVTGIDVGVCDVAHLHDVPQATVVIGIEHLGSAHSIGITERTAIADARST